MVCGGTGVTPMWQVFRAILDDPNDRTEVSLVFANVTVDDILLKEQMDELANTEDRFSVYYVLNNPPEGLDWRRWLCESRDSGRKIWQGRE
eukprot:FN605756.1.p1 GENE.FN605756.1~~FN605756.1.p1  ORF type:complete len:91 (-),score=15.62 FN605756.1:12-284(-)